MSVSLESWRQTWQELGARAPDDGLYQQLIACWNEEHRRYHTLQHLRECLAHFAAVRDQAQRPAEIELALWFHDAFYEPRRDDNELRSAQWARSSVLQAGLPVDAADRVQALVMATCHDAVPEDADAQLLVDVDLSILGAEPARFDEFDGQIRAEYSHVPDEAYRQGRSRVLISFLTRPRLYSTEYFHTALEQRARHNLQRALARLSG